MKRIFPVLILALFMTGPLGAKEQARSTAPWYAYLAQKLNLNDSQKTQLAEAYALRSQKTTPYKQAKEAFKAARKSGDPQAQAHAKKALAEARVGYNAAKKKFNTALDQILTDEQKLGYEGMKLFMGIAYYVKPANITADQKAQIQKLCDQVAPQLLALKKSTPKERNKIKQILLEQIFQTVLTEKQRAAARTIRKRFTPKAHNMPKVK